MCGEANYFHNELILVRSAEESASNAEAEIRLKLGIALVWISNRTASLERGLKPSITLPMRRPETLLRLQ